MQIKENTSIHPGKISLGVGRYALSSHNTASIRPTQNSEHVHRVYCTYDAQPGLSCMLVRFVYSVVCVRKVEPNMVLCRKASWP